MKKPGTFGGLQKTAPKNSAGNAVPEGSEFFHELTETGRADWKKAPKEVRARYRGIFLILCSIPFILLPGWEIYRRVSGTSVKRVQEGELDENKNIRKFSEAEKWQTERESIMYKIFGKDFFLDGFTSKSMSDQDKGKK